MKQFVWGAVIAILVVGVIAEVSFVYWQYVKIQNLEHQVEEIKAELQKIKTEKGSSGASESSFSEERDSAANSGSGQNTESSSQASSPAGSESEGKKNIHISETYGYQLTIPEEYEDYKMTVADYFETDGVAYAYFLFKTSEDGVISAENPATGEEFPGYTSVFAVSIWEKGEYRDFKEECEEEFNPGCPTGAIGENEDYIFEASLGNGVVPDDLLELRNMIDASSGKTLKQALEFETI